VAEVDAGHRMRVTVRYFAGARAASGVDAETIELDAGVAPTVATLAELLAVRHGSALARVLTASSFLLDEVAGGPGRVLRDGVQVDVLPPFAGG